MMATAAQAFQFLVMFGIGLLVGYHWGFDSGVVDESKRRER